MWWVTVGYGGYGGLCSGSFVACTVRVILWLVPHCYTLPLFVRLGGLGHTVYLCVGRLWFVSTVYVSSLLRGYAPSCGLGPVQHQSGNLGFHQVIRNFPSISEAGLTGGGARSSRLQCSPHGSAHIVTCRSGDAGMRTITGPSQSHGTTARGAGNPPCAHPLLVHRHLKHREIPLPLSRGGKKHRAGIPDSHREKMVSLPAPLI